MMWKMCLTLLEWVAYARTEERNASIACCCSPVSCATVCISFCWIAIWRARAAPGLDLGSSREGQGKGLDLGGRQGKGLNLGGSRQGQDKG